MIVFGVCWFVECVEWCSLNLYISIFQVRIKGSYSDGAPGRGRGRGRGGSGRGGQWSAGGDTSGQWGKRGGRGGAVKWRGGQTMSYGDFKSGGTLYDQTKVDEMSPTTFYSNLATGANSAPIGAKRAGAGKQTSSYAAKHTQPGQSKTSGSYGVSNYEAYGGGADMSGYGYSTDAYYQYTGGYSDPSTNYGYGNTNANNATSTNGGYGGY